MNSDEQRREHNRRALIRDELHQALTRVLEVSESFQSGGDLDLVRVQCAAEALTRVLALTPARGAEVAPPRLEPTRPKLRVVR
ncbi:MAG: hypothetical protein HOW73_00790 [Polyangiaceae bacterium]|nr:hypothetical protein [Polyangiaceae bacterium]